MKDSAAKLRLVEDLELVRDTTPWRRDANLNGRQGHPTRGTMMDANRWRVKVEQLMSCSCNWGCPCSFNAPPTYGNCEAALAYRIVKGTHGGVALDGLKWIL